MDIIEVINIGERFKNMFIVKVIIEHMTEIANRHADPAPPPPFEGSP
jgi:hypothetical protein